MTERVPLVPLGQLMSQRKQFITIDDAATYTRVRVQLHAQGIVLRDRATGADIRTKKQQVARKGDFLVAEIDAKVGGFGFVPEGLDGAIVSSHYFLFEVDERRLEPQFLDYVSRTRMFRKQIEAQGSTNYAAIRPSDVLAYVIPLPALSVQRSVVSRIKAIEGQMREASELRTDVARIASAIYQRRLSEVLDRQDADWSQATVGDVIRTIDAGWSPQCTDSPAAGDAWGVLKTTAVQWCAFLPEENKALPPSLAARPELGVRKGDVLVTRAGPVKRVGVPAAVRRDFPTLMISDKLVRLRPKPEVVASRFLELALAGPLAQEHLFHRKTGLADAQVNISQSILRSTPICVPPLPEQERIIHEMDQLQQQLAKLEEACQVSTTLIEGLFPALLERTLTPAVAV